MESGLLLFLLRGGSEHYRRAEEIYRFLFENADVIAAVERRAREERLDEMVRKAQIVRE